MKLNLLAANKKSIKVFNLNLIDFAISIHHFKFDCACVQHVFICCKVLIHIQVEAKLFGVHFKRFTVFSINENTDLTLCPS